MTGYADRPWLRFFTEEQRDAADHPPSVLHGFLARAAEHPGRRALAYFDGGLTYGELDALSDGLARHLAARGLAPGDRVALMLQNVPQFAVVLLAAWKAGAAAVPVNPMYKRDELAHILGDAGAAAVVCSEQAWEDYVRDTVAASPVRIALTACERDLQTRDDPRVLTAPRLPAEDAPDVLAAARAAA
ncbi:MAG: AMP-binding protein, partial [Streptomyces sp.]|nr:AMP-binding protein [Streptomyces sp.]